MDPYVSRDELARALALRDLSDPAQGPHAMQTLLAQVVDDLTGLWGIPARLHRFSPLVAVEDNYDKLGFDRDAVTRDRRYSRYVSPTVMLRSHTSASIPGVLADLAGEAEVDRLLVLAGLVYRRDVIDRRHVGAPHQVDLWRIASHGGLTPSDLHAMVATIVGAVLPGAEWRTVAARHPYTSNGLQIDVRVGDDWLELAECGLIAGSLLERAGLEPGTWSGLALGMGLDRALMLRKGIDDIRLLRARDPRIAEQLLDLRPWRPVSAMPPIRRDLSIVVAADIDDETLGDRVRGALGDRSEDLESVEILGMTGYDALPPQARDRLRLRPDQVNALIRVTLRPLSATLTDSEANEIRDAIYLALHEGPVAELISS